jgi:GNAT superfamily N-acetyltransferase
MISRPARSRSKAINESRFVRSRSRMRMALWALDRLLAVVGQGVVRTPEEVTTNPEETELSIRKWLTRDLGIFVVADLDGQVVGQARVSVPPLARLAHNGTFEVSVHPEFQGIGIGRALTEACLAWARGAGLIQISLSVIASNTGARTLYEHCGFRCEDGRHLYIRHPDGVVRRRCAHGLGQSGPVERLGRTNRDAHRLIPRFGPGGSPRDYLEWVARAPASHTSSRCDGYHGGLAPLEHDLCAIPPAKGDR